MESFDYEQLLKEFRYPLLILFIGAILVGLGFLFLEKQENILSEEVEVLSEETLNDKTKIVTAEISGCVARPGVYGLTVGSRVDDLINAAGGFTAAADKVWTEKYLNRAAKITDGQKVFIPAIGYQSGNTTANKTGEDQSISTSFSSDSSGFININTASLQQLDSLPGIGQKYGQSIIEHRPYSNILELVSKSVLGQSLFEKIKDNISVY